MASWFFGVRRVVDTRVPWSSFDSGRRIFVLNQLVKPFNQLVKPQNSCRNRRCCCMFLLGCFASEARQGARCVAPFEEIKCWVAIAGAIMAIVWSEMCRHALVDVPLPALLNKLYAVGGILARVPRSILFSFATRFSFFSPTGLLLCCVCCREWRCFSALA